MNRAPRRPPAEHARLFGLAVVPILLLVGGIFVLLRLGEWRHQRNLPEDYESFTSDRFVVYHPVAMRERAERIVAEAEEFLNLAPAAFETRLGDLTPPSQRIRLTLFRNHQEFKRFTREVLQEDMSSNGGYFDAANLEIVLVLTTGNIDSLGIRHEVSHLLVARGGGHYGSSLPRWLNEGLATWLETADLTAPGRSGPLAGWVRLVAAATGEHPSLESVLSLDHHAFRSQSNDLAYAYANLLVHFLVARDSDAFFEFAREVRAGTYTDAEGLTVHFGGVSALEAGFRGFVEARVAEFDAEYRGAVKRGESPPLR